MTNPPLFSIVTIGLNNLNGFKKTHKSLSAQSYQKYEWIIVDGASTDGTIDYVHQNNLNNFCISEKDGGLYDAMNKGVKRATGDYILFLNAGDSLADADILSTLSKSIAAHAPDFIYGDALEERLCQHPFYKKSRSHKKFIHGMFTHHQSMLYRRAMIKGLKYNDSYKIAADYDFTVQFLLRVQKIHYIPCAICIFEQGGISQRQMHLGRLEQFKIRKNLTLCSFSKNTTVIAVQYLSALLKNVSPLLYEKFRKN